MKQYPKFSLYKEAFKCFEGRLAQAKAWAGRIGSAMVPTAAFLAPPIALIVAVLSPSNSNVSPPDISLGWIACTLVVIGLLLFSLFALAWMSRDAPRHHVFGESIVPDAGLMRIAQSRVIPDDIKREVATIFQHNGAVRFNDLFWIDRRLREQRKAQQRIRDQEKHSQKEQAREQKEQIKEQKRRRGAGAVALQAVLNTGNKPKNALT
jgi:hypothetical protein